MVRGFIVLVRIIVVALIALAPLVAQAGEPTTIRLGLLKFGTVGTHDLAEAQAFGDRIVVLRGSPARIVEDRRISRTAWAAE